MTVDDMTQQEKEVEAQNGFIVSESDSDSPDNYTGITDVNGAH